jgi:hypothetical protein
MMEIVRAFPPGRGMERINCRSQGGCTKYARVCNASGAGEVGQCVGRIVPCDTTALCQQLDFNFVCSNLSRDSSGTSFCRFAREGELAQWQRESRAAADAAKQAQQAVNRVAQNKQRETSAALAKSQRGAAAAVAAAVAAARGAGSTFAMSPADAAARQRAAAAAASAAAVSRGRGLTPGAGAAAADMSRAGQQATADAAAAQAARQSSADKAACRPECKTGEVAERIPGTKCYRCVVPPLPTDTKPPETKVCDPGFVLNADGGCVPATQIERPPECPACPKVRCPSCPPQQSCPTCPPCDVTGGGGGGSGGGGGGGGVTYIDKECPACLQKKPSIWPWVVAGVATLYAVTR